MDYYRDVSNGEEEKFHEEKNRAIQKGKKGRWIRAFNNIYIYFVERKVLDEGKKKFDGKRKRPNEGCIDSIKRSSYSFNKYNRCPKTSRIKNVYTRKKKKKRRTEESVERGPGPEKEEMRWKMVGQAKKEEAESRSRIK